MEFSDVQMLDRIAARDRSAFAAFYDRHAPQVLGLLVKLLGRRSDAEDALQETFCQVWRDAGKYDVVRSSPRGWLFMLARSRGLDHARRKRPTADVGQAPEPLAPEDAAGAVAQAEAAELVRAALARLPEEQRAAVTLAFFSGLTHGEVADRMAVPLGTAKTRIRLAMNRLRDLLREQHDEVSAS